MRMYRLTLALLAALVVAASPPTTAMASPPRAPDTSVIAYPALTPDRDVAPLAHYTETPVLVVGMSKVLALASYGRLEGVTIADAVDTGPPGRLFGDTAHTALPERLVCFDARDGDTVRPWGGTDISAHTLHSMISTDDRGSQRHALGYDQDFPLRL